MQSRLHLALDALALLLAKATFIGLRLLTLYLAAASLGRADFGSIALAFTTAEICRYVGDWGMDTWALRQFSNPDLSCAGARFRWVMRVRVASSFVAAGLAWVAIEGLAPQIDPWRQGAIALTAVTSLWLNLGVNWLQARAALRPVALALSGIGILCLGALLFGHTQRADITQQVLTLIAFEGVMVVAVMALAVRTLPRGTTQAGLTAVTVPQWFKSATPIALAALVALSYGRLDQYFVSRTATPEVLGDYTLAQRIVEPVLFVLAAMASTIYTRASAFFMSHGSGEATRNYARRWQRLVGAGAVVIGLIIGAAFTFLAPLLLSGYVGATPFLWLALLCTVFRCMNLCLTAFIQAVGAYGKMFRISLINAVTITSAVLTAGTIFGPLGAAAGVCLGEAINTALQSLTLKKLLASEHPA